MLDVLTPRGLETLSDEQRCALIFEARVPGCQYIGTPKHKPAAVDAVVLRGGTIISVVEQKTRYNMTWRRLLFEFGGEWLVTSDKLDRARDVARALCVPLYGVLYLPADDMVLIQRLTGSDGEWAAAIRRAVTVTQRTVNGGTAERLNAFIDMRQARVLTAGGAL